MRAVIFSGTTEGRELSALLARRGVDTIVCVATAYGAEEQGQTDGVTVLEGRKDAASMAQVLRGCDLCIDATHPYAVEATATIRKACEAAQVRLLRLLRGAEMQSGDGVIAVGSAAEAAAWLAEREGNILLTTGAKELGAFSALDPARLYPRVLPSHSSLDACEAAGIPHRNILALQGPFSRELNEAMIRQYAVRYLVTKDGGRAGGAAEKLEAARNTGAEVILIRRPEETGMTFSQIVSCCEEMMK